MRSGTTDPGWPEAPARAVQGVGERTTSLDATGGSSHTLTTALTVGASGQSNNPLAVTLQNDSTMGLTAPAACASTFFSMPSLIGITATGGAATSTTTPATDGWTS